MVWRKKRTFLVQLERDLYSFLSHDFGDAWENSSPLVITFVDTWCEYLASLYIVSKHSPLPKPQSHVHKLPHAIDTQSTRRSPNHDGLGVEHFIHARHMIANSLVLMFDRAMCVGFLESWSTSTIVPILKSADPSLSTDYRTIVIGHSLAKLYASVLEHEPSK